MAKFVKVVQKDKVKELIVILHAGLVAAASLAKDMKYPELLKNCRIADMISPVKGALQLGKDTLAIRSLGAVIVEDETPDTAYVAKVLEAALKTSKAAPQSIVKCIQEDRMMPVT